MNALLTPDELEATLRRVGAERYHHLHPFHRRLHAGASSKAEVQAWALNRYCYQAAIPIKDATILTRIEEPELRRAWRKRLEDHDGRSGDPGGIEKWLRLTDALGFARHDVISRQLALPATLFATGAYVEFCRSRTLLEGIASSLTELFSPMVIEERISGMLAHYDFIDTDALSYFSDRPQRAEADAGFALDYVRRHAETQEAQQAAISALVFKCSVLWAQLDALWHAYVEGHVPPGAWHPEEGR